MHFFPNLRCTRNQHQPTMQHNASWKLWTYPQQREEIWAKPTNTSPLYSLHPSKDSFDSLLNTPSSSLHIHNLAPFSLTFWGDTSLFLLHTNLHQDPPHGIMTSVDHDTTYSTAGSRSGTHSDDVPNDLSRMPRVRVMH